MRNESSCSAILEPLWINNKKYVSTSGNELGKSSQVQDRNTQEVVLGPKEVVSQVGEAKAKT